MPVVQCLLEKSAGSHELQWLHGLRTGTWGEQMLELAPERRLERFSTLSISPEGQSRQSMHALDSIDSIARQLQGQYDTYVSQATFVGTSRRKSMFCQVRACWVDLDLHKDGLVLDGAMVREIRNHCRALSLPEPSLIVASGRGAYLKWILERAVTDLPAWDAAQSLLVVLFQRFLADKRARDVCRVFRLLGTRNSKVKNDADSIVRVIDGCGQECSFEALAQALEAVRGQIELPKGLAEAETEKPSVRRETPSKALNRWSEELRLAAERGSIEELEIYSKLRAPIFSGNRKSPASLGWARFCDLRDLFMARGGIAVGQRDLALFWMVNSLAHAGVVSSANWNEEIKELLRAFPRVGEGFDPLKDGSLSTLNRRLKNTEALREQIAQGLDPQTNVSTEDLLYRPTNAYLIETFDISPEEQSRLKTIIDAQERQRRRDAKAPGRAERRQRRQELRERVRAWLQAHQGVCNNISALARELGEAVGRVWRIVRSLIKEMSPEKAHKTDAGDKPVEQARGRIVSARQFMVGKRKRAEGTEGASPWVIPPRGCLGPGRLVRETVTIKAPLYLRIIMRHIKFRNRPPTAQELAKLMPSPPWKREIQPGSALHRLLQRVREDAAASIKMTHEQLGAILEKAKRVREAARFAAEQEIRNNQRRLQEIAKRMQQRAQTGSAPLPPAPDQAKQTPRVVVDRVQQESLRRLQEIIERARQRAQNVAVATTGVNRC